MTITFFIGGILSCLIIIWAATIVSFPFNFIHIVSALIIWRTLWKNRDLIKGE